MHAILTNPKMRFAFSLGASMGIGFPLFRGLTENLGPIVGLVVFLPSIALITSAITLALTWAGRQMDAAAKI